MTTSHGDGGPGCARFRARLEDALDERRLEAFDNDPHASSCPACREALEAFRALDAILASEPAASPPVDLAPLVLARVKVEASRSRRRAKLSLVGTAAAAIVLALGLELVASPLRSGFDRLLDDARALGARADSLSDELPSIDSVKAPAIPQAPGSLAMLALAAALAIGAGEVAWLRRGSRRVGAS